MLEGSCLCGRVRYAVTGAPLAMYHCYCGTCRAASGASFATNVAVATEHFAITAGGETLSSFESNPGKRRYFCANCGSPIYSHGQQTAHLVSIRCGTLHGDPGVRPSFHAYVADKVPWAGICDALPQYPAART